METSRWDVPWGQDLIWEGLPDRHSAHHLEPSYGVQPTKHLHPEDPEPVRIQEYSKRMGRV